MTDSHDRGRHCSLSSSSDKWGRPDDADSRSWRRGRRRSPYKSRSNRSNSPSNSGSHRREHGRYKRSYRHRSTSSGDDRRLSSPPGDRNYRRKRRRSRDTYSDRERPLRRQRSRSTSQSRSIRRYSRSPSLSREQRRKKQLLSSQTDAYSSSKVSKREGASPGPAVEKEKPNFELTGRLAAESNTVTVGGSSVVLKYHEPPEARKAPAKEPWRLYVFKGDDMLEVLELSGRSCWLIGRERLVVDFPLDHPSCSKQHAALQFRFTEKKNEFGDRIGKVKPYIIDLDSANGTSINGDPVPPRRFIELMDKDVVRFGLSSREYVLMLPPA